MNEQEIKHLIEEDIQLNKETNDMVKKMVSAQRWARFFRVIYWTVIIGGSIGVYYWLQPIIGTILGDYQSVMKNLDKIQTTTSQALPSQTSINSILEKLRGGQ